MDLGQLIQIEIGGFLVGLSSIVFYLILTGKINTKNLLSEQSQTYSLPRLQLLIFTLATTV